MVAGALPLPTPSDVRVTWLVSFGHFFAHLNVLVLPPLFPLLTEAYGVGYTSLGLALGVLNVTTLLTQAPIGVLVDRFGAARILIAGHMLFAFAVAMTGVWPSFAVLLVLMVLAGLGNAVYHPADYAILARAVPRERMGRAFGIHTFGGYLGFAAAPVATVGLAELLGWRWALVLIGLAGMLLGLVLVTNRELLGQPRGGTSTARSASGGAGLDLFTSPPILLSLAFFALLAMAQSGFSTFSVAALTRLQGFTLVEASAPLTGYLVGTTVGVLIGGWAADRTDRHGLVVALCFLVTALFAALLALVRFPLVETIVLFVLAGIAGGFVSPSRDMLVRRVTPPGASGRVFGFVTTGFNIGGFLAPPLFGLVVDLGRPELVFWLVAVLSLLTLLTVTATANASRAPAAPA
jgi:FSR family fosmidomycin resistance protein-like MFS transporter